MLDSDYDRSGNREFLRLNPSGENLEHHWVFGLLDRLDTVTLPGSAADLVFTFVADDRLDTLQHGDGLLTDYDYHAQGPISGDGLKR